MSKQYALGIDLGTSNSALALASVSEPSVQTIEVTQLESQKMVAEKPTLASTLYLPHAGECSGDDLRLPWDGAEVSTDVVGSFARERGATSPDRVVTSAKSWLCNNQVDRKEPILPWGSDLAERKVSPFEASRKYLEHLRKAFSYAKPSGPTIEECGVVLTVPASFDEVARSLTFEAAREAGIEQLTLLEEPQAAFYAWIAQSEDRWREEVSPGDIVLVCDVGGGTADFSLIAVSEQDGNLALERISVGDHILLGGDNMDLALAYALRAQLEGTGVKLDQWQFLSLIQSARAAKEKLFSDDELTEVPIAVPSRGSSLFAGAVSTSLKRELLDTIVVDGFFARTSSSEMPKEQPLAGLKEYGLPFASDPVLSKHLAYFLRRSLSNVQSDHSLSGRVSEDRIDSENGILKPSAVLFNGGVFNAEPLRKRVLGLLNSWSGEGEVVRELAFDDLDLAVSRGAAAYGRLVQGGEGLRIKAGTARSYYLGIETSMLAVPGFTPPLKGVCVTPQGTEEGSQFELRDREFGLVVGETVEFRFFCSSVRAGDDLGTVVENAEQELEETAHLTASLPAAGDFPGRVVPVRLSAFVTEMGTLELWMKHTQSDQQWKLEFNVRAQ